MPRVPPCAHRLDARGPEPNDYQRHGHRRLDRIASVDPSSKTAQVHGQVLDANGMYVIPGLWDMHTHAYFGWPRDFGDNYVLPLFIANGITGIRDMGSDLGAVLRART